MADNSSNPQPVAEGSINSAQQEEPVGGTAEALDQDMTDAHSSEESDPDLPDLQELRDENEDDALKHQQDDESSSSGDEDSGEQEKDGGSDEDDDIVNSDEDDDYEDGSESDGSDDDEETYVQSRPQDHTQSHNAGAGVHHNSSNATANSVNDEPNFVPESDADVASMTQLQKFDRYIRSDIPLQRLVYIKLLNETARVSGVDDTVNFILPKLPEISNDPELVIRQSVAEELGALAKFLVVEDPKMGGTTEKRGPAYNCVIDSILPRIKEMLTDPSSEVRQAAGEALVDIAQLLDADDVGKCVLTMVLCMAHDDNDEHRTTAVPLMNELAPILGQDICRLFLAQEIVALSEDPSFRVKKATAQNFGNVCKIVGEAYSIERLLPAFVVLSKDTIWSVRKGCVESLVAVSESVSLEKRVDTLMPMFESFAKDVSRWVRNGAYEVLGPFIHTLDSDQLSPEFVRYYTEIPELSNSLVDSDVTFFCAYNFSAVVLTLGPDRWAELIGAYNLLVKDTKFKVRKTLSHSLHEIAKILGTALTEEHLTAPFEAFLKDLDEVRIGVIRSISQFLEVLSPETRTKYLNILWDLSMEPDQNWRFRQILAEQLKDLATLFSVEITINTIVPLTIALCDDRLDCIRKVAVKSLGNLLTRLDAPESKNAHESLVNRIRQFGTHKKFQRRQLYIEICEHLVDSLPWSKIKSEFLPLLLERHKDPISNVRLTLARLCKNKLLSHERFKNDEEFLRAVENLKNDTSVDVCFFLLTPKEMDTRRSRPLSQRSPTTTPQSASQTDADLDYIRGDNSLGSDLTESKIEASNDSSPPLNRQESPQEKPSIIATTEPSSTPKQKVKMDTPRPRELLEALQNSKKDDAENDEDPQKPPSDSPQNELKRESENTDKQALDSNGDVSMVNAEQQKAELSGSSSGTVDS